LITLRWGLNLENKESSAPLFHSSSRRLSILTTPFFLAATFKVDFFQFKQDIVLFLGSEGRPEKGDGNRSIRRERLRFVFHY